MDDKMIKLAADSIAREQFEKGFDPRDDIDRECILDAVRDAFASDPLDVKERAVDWASGWLDKISRFKEEIDNEIKKEKANNA